MTRYFIQQDPLMPRAGHTHAHPLPHYIPDPVKVEYIQHLQDVFPDGLIEMRLMGGPVTPSKRLVDVYSPKVWRSPSGENDTTDPSSLENPTNLLDVVYCWKGASTAQAANIMKWESVFHHALEKQANQALIAGMISYLTARRRSPKREQSILTRVGAFLTFDNRCMIGIDIESLIDDMIQGSGVYYWSGDSILKDPDMVKMFLLSRYCFRNCPPFDRPCIEVLLGYERRGNRLSVSGEVMWQPPNTTFTNLMPFVMEGYEYFIAPYFREVDLFYKTLCKDSSFIETQIHSERSTLPLPWNEATKSFRGYVPKGIPELHTELWSIVTRPFADGLRFESTARYRLTAEVWKLASTPDVEPLVDSAVIAEMCRTTTGHKNLEKMLKGYGFENRFSRLQLLDGPKMRPWQAEKHGTRMRKETAVGPYDGRFRVSSAFKSHRFALDEFEHVNPETALKREKTIKRIDLPINSEGHSTPDDPLDEDGIDNHDLPFQPEAVSTGPLGQALSSPTSESCFWSKKMEIDNGREFHHVSKSRAYEARAMKVMPALRKKGSVKRMVFRRPKPVNEPSPPYSHASSEIDAGIVSPGRSQAPLSPRMNVENVAMGLNQSEIQDNYRQCLIAKLRAELKGHMDKAPVLSGRKVSENECREFESIFIGDEGGRDGDWDVGCGSSADGDIDMDMSESREESEMSLED